MFLKNRKIEKTCFHGRAVRAARGRKNRSDCFAPLRIRGPTEPGSSQLMWSTGPAWSAAVPSWEEIGLLGPSNFIHCLS